jgi:hypothetical protein
MINEIKQEHGELVKKDLTSTEAACYLYWTEDIVPPTSGHSLSFFLQLCCRAKEIALLCETFAVRKVSFDEYCKNIEARVAQ